MGKAGFQSDEARAHAKLLAMDHRPHLLRWREIVHPLFWPVFFWNLRRFVVVLGRLRAEQGDNGQIAYEITWWGAIRIHWTYPEAEAEWDAELGACARRIHLATLDVFNPYLSTCVPLSLAEGEGPGVRDLFRLRSVLASGTAALTLDPSPAGGRGRRAGLALGVFPEPGHLNTS